VTANTVKSGSVIISGAAQPDSSAGVLSGSPAVQPEKQVGEGEVEMEVEACLPLLSHHPHLLQSGLTQFSVLYLRLQTGVSLVKPKFTDGWDKHQNYSLRSHL